MWLIAMKKMKPVSNLVYYLPKDSAHYNCDKIWGLVYAEIFYYSVRKLVNALSFYLVKDEIKKVLDKQIALWYKGQIIKEI